MRAINHALTGAVIGLSVAEPAIALPAAFFSHFVCDTIPHFGSPKVEVGSRRFTVFLIVDALLCVALVAWIFFSGSPNWWLASACAFLAASPDFLELRRFVALNRRKQFSCNRLEFILKKIQWFERPIGAWVEAAWFAAGLIVITAL